jgi:hypothetical protein
MKTRHPYCSWICHIYKTSCLRPWFPIYTIILGISPEGGQQGPKHVAAKIYNKHLEELLQGTVLLITLIKCAQQDAEPQNKEVKKYMTTCTAIFSAYEN